MSIKHVTACPLEGMLIIVIGKVTVGQTTIDREMPTVVGVYMDRGY